MKAKYDSSLARVVAREMIEALVSACVPGRLIVAGSLRRGKKEVGDIELVYVPRIEERRGGDLFKPALVDCAAEILDGMLVKGVIGKRPNVNGHTAWGPKNKLGVHMASGIPVDFFATSEENWAVTCVIRTGPKELNLKLIGEAAKRGLSLHAYGDGFTDQRTGERVVCRSEEDVFKFAGVPYLEPEKR